MFNLNYTTAYKNLLDDDRVGHHNYVITQAVSNTSRQYGKVFDDLSDEERDGFDKEMFMRLVNLDHNVEYNKDKGCGIIDINEVTDSAKVVDVYGQGCNYPTDKGVDGYEAQFKVLAFKRTDDATAEFKEFTVALQSSDRSDNIKTYNGYEMDFAVKFGADWDESIELEDFIDDYDTAERFKGYLVDKAKAMSKEWLESNLESTPSIDDMSKEERTAAVEKMGRADPVQTLQ